MSWCNFSPIAVGLWVVFNFSVMFFFWFLLKQAIFALGEHKDEKEREKEIFQHFDLTRTNSYNDK